MFTLARSTMVLTRAGARMKPRVAQDKYVLVHKPKEKLFVMQINETDDAIIQYNKRRNVYILIHSHVPEHLRGRGIGHIISEKTFQYIADHNLQFRILCKFIMRVYQEHESKFQKYYR